MATAKKTTSRNTKARSTRARSSSASRSSKSRASRTITGSGGLRSAKRFNWLRNGSIAVVVGLVGGYLVWHSFAAIKVYANQYSIAKCSSTSATQPSNVEVYASPTATKAMTDLASCQDYSAEAKIYNLYTTIANREPDVSGYNHWIQKLAGDRVNPSALEAALKKEAKASAGATADRIVQVSNGATSTSTIPGTASTAPAKVDLVVANPVDKKVSYTNPDTLPGTYKQFNSPASFVDSIYSKLLGRTADAAGRQWWADQLSSGKTTPAKAVATIADTQEGRNYFVTQVYTSLLGRKPDASGLAFWAKRAAATGAQRQATVNAIAAASGINQSGDNSNPSARDNRETGPHPQAPDPIDNATSQSPNPTRSKFLAFVKSHPSPKVLEVAKLAQSERVKKADGYVKFINGHYNNFNGYVKQGAATVKEAENIAALGGKMSQANLDKLRTYPSRMTTLFKYMSVEAGAMDKEYKNLTAIVKQADAINAYSPDISVKSWMDGYVSSGKNALKKKDSQVNLFRNNYVPRINAALKKANTDFQVNLEQQATNNQKPANQRDLAAEAAACKAANSFWSASTSSCNPNKDKYGNTKRNLAAEAAACKAKNNFWSASTSSCNPNKDKYGNPKLDPQAVQQGTGMDSGANGAKYKYYSPARVWCKNIYNTRTVGNRITIPIAGGDINNSFVAGFTCGGGILRGYSSSECPGGTVPTSRKTPNNLTVHFCRLK